MVDADKKGPLKNKFAQTLSFAESIQKKIQSDPIKYDIQKKYLSQFTE